MGSNCSIIYACLRLRFPDVENNLAQHCPVSAANRILCSNVRGPFWSLSDLTVASTQYDILAVVL